AILIALFAMILAACAGAPASAPAAGDEAAPADGEVPAGRSTETFEAEADVLMKTMGVSDPSEVNDVVLAAMHRAGLPVSEEMAALALQCWREKECDT